MTTNTKWILAGGILLLGAAFYAGSIYGRSGAYSPSSPGSGGFNRGTRSGLSGGFTSGSVIAKDASTLTLQLPGGNTKIALIGSSTEVMKTTAGTLDDVVQGAMISVTGTANSDGSITASSIQIRPQGFMRGKNPPSSSR